jgi:hypothetical protein
MSSLERLSTARAERSEVSNKALAAGVLAGARR